MLVLSRKPGEKIHVGPHVTITIVRIGPNTVRLGIDAPPEMNIVRDELLDLGDGRVMLTIEVPVDTTVPA